jgi:hypothetical protein
MTKNEAITADLEQKSLIAATEATATTEAQFLEHLGRWQNVCQQDSPQSAPASDFSKGKVIVDLGSALSRLTLYGNHVELGWQFCCELSNTPSAVRDELAGHYIQTATGEWLAARQQLDSACENWYFLAPIFVHPEFRKEILRTVERKYTLTRLKHWIAEMR